MTQPITSNQDPFCGFDRTRLKNPSAEFSPGFSQNCNKVPTVVWKIAVVAMRKEEKDPQASISLSQRTAPLQSAPAAVASDPRKKEKGR
jgi:hypothetical protein